MRYYLLAGALLATLPTLGQTTPAAAPGSAAANSFCVVRSYGILNDSRPSFALEAGTPAKDTTEPPAAQAFKRENLRSVADMLAYMDRTGWELLTTAGVAGEWPAGTVPKVEYQYIFRRKAR